MKDRSWGKALPQQITFPRPGLLDGLLRGGRRVDLSVDLPGVGGPIADGGADQPEWDPGVVGNQRQQRFLRQVGLSGAGGAHRAHDLPDVGASDKAGAAAGRPIAEDDPGMLGHP